MQGIKVIYDKQIMRRSFTLGQKIFLFNHRLHLFLAKSMLSLVWSIYCLHYLFHMEPLKLRIQRILSLLKLMVKN